MNSKHVPLSLRISLLPAVAALAACAGFVASDCRETNWYDVGYRDARFRLQSQAAVYAEQCARYGVGVDAKQYEEGLRQGRWDFPDRMT
jgi:hypothetical protein